MVSAARYTGTVIQTRGLSMPARAQKTRVSFQRHIRIGRSKLLRVCLFRLWSLFNRIQHKLFSISHAILLSPSFLLFYYTPLSCFYQISALNISIDQISSYVFYEFVFVWFLLADDHQVSVKKILTWIIFNSFYPDSTKPDYQIETS